MPVIILLLLLHRPIAIATATATPCPVLLPQHPPETATTSRVVGGVTASPVLASYLALLLTPRWDGRISTCSAVILSPTLLLTAAHCNVSQTTSVFLATSSSYPLPVAFVVAHPRYRPHHDAHTASFDIAYVRLARSPSPHHQPTPRFMKVNTNTRIPVSRSVVRVAGYGVIASNLSTSNPSLRLHQLDLPVLPNSKCVKTHLPFHIPINISAQLCAGYLDKHPCGSCRGDSGGPLLQYDHTGAPVVVAIVSRGVRCGDARFPGIYVRTAAHASFFPADVHKTRHTDSLMHADATPITISNDNISTSLPLHAILLITFSAFIVVVVLPGFLIFSRWFQSPISQHLSNPSISIPVCWPSPHPAHGWLSNSPPVEVVRMPPSSPLHPPT